MESHPLVPFQVGMGVGRRKVLLIYTHPCWNVTMSLLLLQLKNKLFKRKKQLWYYVISTGTQRRSPRPNRNGSESRKREEFTQVKRWSGWGVKGHRSTVERSIKAWNIYFGQTWHYRVLDSYWKVVEVGRGTRGMAGNDPFKLSHQAWARLTGYQMFSK